MITTRSVYGYIGGSDANRLFGSFGSATFKMWWQERLTGIQTNQFSTLDTAVGNIMESRILDEVEVGVEYRSVSKKKDGTMAGVNTDALDDHFLHEVKTCLVGDLYDWLRGCSISAAYRRQIQHGLYVTERQAAKVHALGMTRKEKKNPWLVDISGRVKTFVFGLDGTITGEGFNVEFKNPKPFDLADYDRRVRYLTECFSVKVWPTDEGFNQFS